MLLQELESHIGSRHTWACMQAMQTIGSLHTCSVRHRASWQSGRPGRQCSHIACYIMLQDLQFRMEAGDRRGFMKEAPRGGKLPTGLWKAMTKDLKEEWPDGDSEEDSESDEDTDEDEDGSEVVARFVEQQQQQQQQQAPAQPSAAAAAQAVEQAIEQEPPVDSTTLPPGALKAMPRAAEQRSAPAAVADFEEFEEVESCIEIEVTPEDQLQEEAQPSAPLAGLFSKLAGAEAGSPPVTGGMKGSVPEATAAVSRPPRSMAAAIERLRMRSRRPPEVPDASASEVSWPTAAEQETGREHLAQAAESLVSVQTEDAAESKGSEAAPLSDDVWEQQLIDQRIEEMGEDAADIVQASSNNGNEQYDVIDEIASMLD